MWSSRLFWKLFLAYAGLIVVTALLFATLVSAWQREPLLGYLQERLYAEAVVLRSHVADQLADGRTEYLNELVNRLSDETATRITMVAADGTVLADSAGTPSQMENHRDRREIAQAAEHGRGVSTHVSRTLGVPMMYLAVRVDRAGEVVGFVRVALPMEPVEHRIAAVQRLVWSIAAAVGLATLVVTYWVVARITQPVDSLTEAARAMAEGDFGRKVYVPNRDELGSLGEAFNRMSGELSARISQLRDEQELLATVLGGMVEGVVAVDAQHRVLFVNDAARTLLGLPDTNVAGRTLAEQMRHAALLDAVREVFAVRQPPPTEFEIAGPYRRLVSLHARRLPGEPPPGAVIVLHDVTELRRLENLRREFVANVSHELKTPLASIKAYAETLLNGGLTDAEHNTAFVKQIEEQANRLHELILDLLSLARIESGREAFEIGPVNLDEAVAACVVLHAAPAAAKRISLQVVPCHDPAYVLADLEGVQQILNNLVNNAIKYTPDGGQVTIRWRPEGAQTMVEVQDTGIGIAPRDQSRVFERFYRVDKARSRELGGTGLGLSIVKHLVQAFGGGVSVVSEFGGGSTFIVRLPTAASKGAGIQNSKLAPPDSN